MQRALQRASSAILIDESDGRRQYQRRRSSSLSELQKLQESVFASQQPVFCAVFLADNSYKTIQISEDVLTARDVIKIVLEKSNNARLADDYRLVIKYADQSDSWLENTAPVEELLSSAVVRILLKLSLEKSADFCDQRKKRMKQDKKKKKTKKEKKGKQPDEQETLRDLHNAWFAGKMTTVPTEKAVLSGKHGDYLIRSSHEGCFVLVVNDTGTICNYEITCDYHFAIGQKKFATLLDLVKDVKVSQLEGNFGVDLDLAFPAPGGIVMESGFSSPQRFRGNPKRFLASSEGHLRSSLLDVRGRSSDPMAGIRMVDAPKRSRTLSVETESILNHQAPARSSSTGSREVPPPPIPPPSQSPGRGRSSNLDSHSEIPVAAGVDAEIAAQEAYLASLITKKKAIQRDRRSIQNRTTSIGASSVEQYSVQSLADNDLHANAQSMVDLHTPALNSANKDQPEVQEVWQPVEDAFSRRHTTDSSPSHQRGRRVSKNGNLYEEIPANSLLGNSLKSGGLSRSSHGRRSAKDALPGLPSRIKSSVSVVDLQSEFSIRNCPTVRSGEAVLLRGSQGQMFTAEVLEIRESDTTIQIQYTSDDGSADVQRLTWSAFNLLHATSASHKLPQGNAATPSPKPRPRSQTFSEHSAVIGDVPPPMSSLSPPLVRNRKTHSFERIKNDLGSVAEADGQAAPLRLGHASMSTGTPDASETRQAIADVQSGMLHLSMSDGDSSKSTERRGGPTPIARPRTLSRENSLNDERSQQVGYSEPVKAAPRSPQSMRKAGGGKVGKATGSMKSPLAVPRAGSLTPRGNRVASAKKKPPPPAPDDDLHQRPDVLSNRSQSLTDYNDGEEMYMNANNTTAQSYAGGQELYMNANEAILDAATNSSSSAEQYQEETQELYMNAALILADSSKLSGETFTDDTIGSTKVPDNEQDLYMNTAEALSRARSDPISHPESYNPSGQELYMNAADTRSIVQSIEAPHPGVGSSATSFDNQDLYMTPEITEILNASQHNEEDLYMAPEATLAHTQSTKGNESPNVTNKSLFRMSSAPKIDPPVVADSDSDDVDDEEDWDDEMYDSVDDAMRAAAQLHTASKLRSKSAIGRSMIRRIRNAVKPDKHMVPPVPSPGELYETPEVEISASEQLYMQPETAMLTGEEPTNEDLYMQPETAMPTESRPLTEDLYMAPESAEASQKRTAVILPSGWVKVYDETHKRDYYFNQVTREVQWSLPS